MIHKLILKMHQIPYIDYDYNYGNECTTLLAKTQNYTVN